MVTQITLRKAAADYSLTRIHALAAQGQVEYVGASERDIGNLEYLLSDVCRCLQCLGQANFSHSERYTETGSWRDVYRIRYPSPKQPIDEDEECVDDLYIKLRLDRDCVVIYLHSFHQTRSI